MRALKERQTDQKFIEHIDDILVWLGSIDSADAKTDRLYAKCLAHSGSRAAVRLKLLKVLDAYMLGSPLSLAHVFGSKAITLCDQSAIRVRYKRLTHLFHPDRDSEHAQWLNPRMVRINEAYKQARQLKKASVGEVNIEVDAININAAAATAPVFTEDIYSQRDQQRDRLWALLQVNVFNRLLGIKPAKIVGVGALLAAAVLGMMALDVYKEEPVLSQLKNGRESNSALGSSTETDAGVVGSVLPLVEAEDRKISSELDALIASTSTKPALSIMNTRKGISLLAEKPELMSEQTEPAIAEGRNKGSGVNNKAMDKELAALSVSTKGKIMKQVNQQQTQKISLQSSKVSAKALIPAALQTMLKSMQQSFAAASAKKYGDHFELDAYHFGEQGRDMIIKRRKRLFDNVESPSIGINVFNYEGVPGWYFVEGDLNTRFKANGQLIMLCQPFSMRVINNGHKLSIDSMLRFVHMETEC